MTSGGARPRARSAWSALTGTGAGAAAVLALLAVACVFVAIAAPRASLGFRTQALRRAIAATTPEGRSVVGQIDYDSLVSGLAPGSLTASADSADLGKVEIGLARSLAALRLPLGPESAEWAGLASGYATVTGAAPRAYNGGVPPQAEVLYRDKLGEFTRLVAGRMPDSDLVTANAASFQVAVTTATAARFGLRVGSLLGMYPQVKLIVTGILRPLRPSSTFWMVDSNAADPTLNTNPSGSRWIGAVFAGGAELTGLEQRLDPNQMQLTWVYPLALHRVNADQAPGLVGKLTAATTTAGEGLLANEDIGLSSGVISTLSDFLQAEDAVAGLLSLLYVSLTIVGIVVLLLSIQLLAERRSAEFALMRARGASSLQLARFAAMVGVVVVLPAAAVGAALAVAVTPGSDDPLAWRLAGLTVLAALTGVPVLVLRRVPGNAAASQRADRSLSRVARARRMIGDLTLVAVAVAGLVILRQQSQSQPGGNDLFTSAAPVLVAVPAAIVVVRSYPPLVRWLARLARLRPGVTAFVGLARASRSSLTAVLPAFALVLALAVIAFGATVRTAVVNGEVAASWRATGADAVVDSSTSLQPLTVRAQHAIAALPGVQRTATAAVLPGIAANGSPLSVVVLNPATYAALIAGTPQPPFPGALLARRPGLAGTAATALTSVPALASPSAVAQAGRRITVSIGLQHVTVRVIGTIAATPAAGSGPFIVLPRWAVGSHLPAPNLMLILGPRLAGGTLRAVVSRMLPGSSVVLRSAALSALTDAVLPRGAYTAFARGAAAAAGFGAAILLIMLILGARQRELTLARLSTMGLSPGQARRLVIAEALPSILAATAGGVASAWVLVPVLGPTLDLSAFTGTGQPVVLRADLPTLGYAAAGLLALALLTLFVQSVAVRLRGAARALRVGE